MSASTLLSSIYSAYEKIPRWKYESTYNNLITYLSAASAVSGQHQTVNSAVVDSAQQRTISGTVAQGSYSPYNTNGGAVIRPAYADSDSIILSSQPLYLTDFTVEFYFRLNYTSAHHPTTRAYTVYTNSGYAGTEGFTSLFSTATINCAIVYDSFIVITYRDSQNYSKNAVYSLSAMGNPNIARYGNRFNHIALVCKNRALSLFVNGQKLYAQLTIPGSSTLGSNYGIPTFIGPSSDSGAMMQTIKLSTRAVEYSNLRIASSAIYNTNFIPSIEPLTTTSQNATGVMLLCFNGSNPNINRVTNTVLSWSSSGNSWPAFYHYNSGPFQQPYGMTAEFTGNSYIQTATSSVLNFMHLDFTIETWIRPTADVGTTHHAIVGTYDESTATPTGWLLALTSAKVLFFRVVTVEGSIVEIQDSGALPTDKWSYVSITKINNILRLAVNGQVVASKKGVKLTAHSAAPIVVGNSKNSSGSIVDSTRGFRGHINNMRINVGGDVYDYNHPVPALPSTVTANTVLAILSNGRFTDRSSNGFSLTVESVTHKMATNTREQLGGSLYFSGSNNLELTGTSVISLPSADFSVEFYFRLSDELTDNTTEIVPRQTIFSNDSNFELWVECDNGLLNATMDSNAKIVLIVGSASIQSVVARKLLTGGWTHISVVRKNSTITLYINGKAATGSISTIPAGLSIKKIGTGSVSPPTSGTSQITKAGPLSYDATSLGAVTSIEDLNLESAIADKSGYITYNLRGYGTIKVAFRTGTRGVCQSLFTLGESGALSVGSITAMPSTGSNPTKAWEGVDTLIIDADGKGIFINKHTVGTSTANSPYFAYWPPVVTGSSPSLSWDSAQQIWCSKIAGSEITDGVTPLQSMKQIFNMSTPAEMPTKWRSLFGFEPTPSFSTDIQIPVPGLFVSFPGTNTSLLIHTTFIRQSSPRPVQAGYKLVIGNKLYSLGTTTSTGWPSGFVDLIGLLYGEAVGGPKNYSSSSGPVLNSLYISAISDGINTVLVSSRYRPNSVIKIVINLESGQITFQSIDVTTSNTQKFYEQQNSRTSLNGNQLFSVDGCIAYYQYKSSGSSFRTGKITATLPNVYDDCFRNLETNPASAAWTYNTVGVNNNNLGQSIFGSIDSSGTVWFADIPVSSGFSSASQSIFGTSTLGVARTSIRKVNSSDGMGPPVPQKRNFKGYISNFIVSSTAIRAGDFTPPTQPYTVDQNTLLLLEGLNTAVYDLEGNGQVSLTGTTKTTQLDLDGGYKKTCIEFFGNGAAILGSARDTTYASLWQLATQANARLLPTWTVEFWCRPKTLSPTVYSTLLKSMFFDIACCENELRVASTSWVGIGHSLTSAVSPTNYDIINTNISANKWIHIAVECIKQDASSSTHMIYVNGQPVSTTPVRFGAAYTTCDYSNRYPITLGNGFNGYIADFKIYRGPKYCIDDTTFANFKPVIEAD